ncbi:F-box/WD repeat-containing protein 2 [Holothuria leucospilota]|uniref:F-box/WD repeat-containing protein 2 n=1 Tax=Holothuria leucospilota TaxID=206669 RepID=A0A9Q0YE55_HOLLE|nr:F-box/WD repeat-containing protein 2 [Holothuria leucospilota]
MALSHKQEAQSSYISGTGSVVSENNIGQTPKAYIAYLHSLVDEAENMEVDNVSGGNSTFRGRSCCGHFHKNGKCNEAGMQKTQFEKWLQGVSRTFVADLSSEQRCLLLDQIITNCGAEQLKHLSNHLEGFLKRDFLKLLPPELGNYLLSWLDPQTLGRSCAVSKHWNKMISECDEVWEKNCRIIGYNSLEDEEDDVTSNNGVRWKAVYKTVLSQLKKLKDGSAFDSKTLRGHTARVYALNYYHGKIASGSDDLTVRLWDVESGQCLKVLNTHTCADVKFDEKMVVTASFDNTVACWDWETGIRLQHFVGHTGAVFCVDYCHAVQLLVSGSADMTVCLWDLEKGTLLQRLTGHAEWVTQVLIGWCTVDTDLFRSGDCIIFSMDKVEIRLWALTEDRSCNLTKILSYPSEQIHGQTFLPRLQFNSEFIACASDIGVLIWSFHSFKLLRRISIPDCSNVFLLGSGSIFTLLLDANSLHVLDSHSQSRVSSWKLPSCRKSKRGSNFIAGDVRWLNGISSHSERGLVFAASTPDHSLHMVRWRTQNR